jgi:hypothetical protein
MKMTKHVYLAGPMRGIPQFNFPAFTKAAELLREEGYHVTSPHEMDIADYGPDAFQDPEGLEVDSIHFNLRTVLGDDLLFICEWAEMVCVLPGWETSKGVRAEIATAEALGIDVVYL